MTRNHVMYQKFAISGKANGKLKGI